MPHPLVIAHRGASRECPENSLAAFARAAELGADAVELDVHRSADGAVVVHHDHRLPDGRAVASVTAAQLARIRVRGEPVPTLGEVVALIGGALTVHCELKGAGTAASALPILEGGADGPRARADARPSARPAGGPHAVHAFDHRQVREAARLAPAVPRGVLEVSYPVDATAAARAVDARDLWRHHEHVDGDLVAAAHAEGRRVIAWTVNDPDTMARFAALGVDGLCTDDVALALRVLGR